MLRAVLVAALVAVVLASSHSEAPGSLKNLRADLTDLYAFTSYEPGRTAFTTLVMNVLPLQAPYGGPNYFAFSDQHFYEFNIDNTGDCVEDIIFQFVYGSRFNGAGNVTLVELDCTGVSTVSQIRDSVKLNINGTMVAIPLKFFGGVSAANTQGNMNFIEYYSLTKVTGSRATGTSAAVTNAAGGSSVFLKPFDYAGEKTFGNAAAYQAYADTFQYNIVIPGCGTQGKMFVGQRADSFKVTLGRIFDLINMVPLVGSIQNCDNENDLYGYNIGSFILELPTSCIVGPSGVIGVWSTIRTLVHSNNDTTTHIPVQQVSRLGNPLVNEVVIGLPDKDKFNGAVPSGDGQFAAYVTNPTLPAIISLLFAGALNGGSNIAPTNFPRADLVAAFLTGITGVNKIGASPTTCEYLRLNTAIAPTARANQNTLGVIAGDNAGFPNGRRPGDDVIDIALRVVMGVLCHAGLGLCVPSDAPFGTQAYTDGSPTNAAYYPAQFPYLLTPYPGATIANPYVFGAPCTPQTWPANPSNPCSTCVCSSL